MPNHSYIAFCWLRIEQKMYNIFLTLLSNMDICPVLGGAGARAWNLRLPKPGCYHCAKRDVLLGGALVNQGPHTMELKDLGLVQQTCTKTSAICTMTMYGNNVALEVSSIPTSLHDLQEWRHAV